MKIGNIICEYRKKHDLSQRDFAKLSGISNSYIAMLENVYDKRTGKEILPTLDMVKKIAATMRLDINELLSMIDDDQSFLIKDTPPSISIPILGRIPAGIPIDMIEDILGYEDISIDMIKGDREYFALKVKGDSMEPNYLDGDVLIVLKQDSCESGQDCIVAVNGYDATFKRVFINDNGITLQPLNSKYAPIFYTNDEINSKPVKILGIIKEIRRSI